MSGCSCMMEVGKMIQKFTKISAGAAMTGGKHRYFLVYKQPEIQS